MKTIKEAANEAFNDISLGVDYLFEEGVEFAQRWIPVEEELPEDSVCFDLRYENVLVKTKNGNVTTSCRIWNLHLSKWEWKGSGTFKDSIVFWRPIEYK